MRGTHLGDRGELGAPARGPALGGAGRPSSNRESPGNGVRVLEGDLLPLLPERRGRVVAQRRARRSRQLPGEPEERRGQRVGVRDRRRGRWGVIQYKRISLSQLNFGLKLPTLRKNSKNGLFRHDKQQPYRQRQKFLAT